MQDNLPPFPIQRFDELYSAYLIRLVRQGIPRHRTKARLPRAYAATHRFIRPVSASGRFLVPSGSRLVFGRAEVQAGAFQPLDP